MNTSKESYYPDEDSIKNCSEKSTHMFGSSSTSSSLSSGHCSQMRRNEDISAEKQSSSSRKQQVFEQKSHSYQDLHSDYTRKRYQHVKSKVKEYIANIKAYDRVKAKKIIRHRSLPETIGTLDACEVIIRETESKLEPNDVVQLLQEKDREVNELRNRNENLESNLQEKLGMLAKLKLNADIMRIELMEIKDKQKRLSLPSIYLRSSAQRYSLPNNIVPFGVSHSSLISTATQTEFNQYNSEPLLCNENELGDEDINNFSDDCVDCTKTNVLRRRSFSNSIHYEDIEIENLVDANNSPNAYNKQKLAKSDDGEAKSFRENFEQCNKLPRRSWRRSIFKPCKRIVLCCGRMPDSDTEFVYTKLPVEEMSLSPTKALFN